MNEKSNNEILIDFLLRKPQNKPEDLIKLYKTTIKIAERKIEHIKEIWKIRDDELTKKWGNNQHGKLTDGIILKNNKHIGIGKQENIIKNCEDKIKILENRINEYD